MARRLTIALVALMAPAGAASAQLSQIERGHAQVQRSCAGCHAVGAAGESRHPNAPAFRRLARMMDFESFVSRLREGLMVGHPDMPTFRFKRRDAQAIAAYLMSIQQSGD